MGCHRLPPSKHEGPRDAAAPSTPEQKRQPRRGRLNFGRGTQAAAFGVSFVHVGDFIFLVHHLVLLPMIARL